MNSQKRLIQHCAALLSTFLIFQTIAFSQPVARYTIPVNSPSETPLTAWVNADELPVLNENQCQLVEITGNQIITVPFQFEPGNPGKLHWIVSGPATGKIRTYELRKGENNQTFENITLSDQNGSLQVLLHQKPVLNYQYKTVYPPAGVDSFFKRSAFLHPVYAPDGTVLTNIQPKDHYHHYGIWNPWTKTNYEGKEIDFWNLVKHEGTVRFAGLISKVEGPVYGGFSAFQKHIIHPDSVETDAIHEVWDLKVYNTSGNVFLWDFTSTINLPLKEIILQEYRYGGFGFRATDRWTNKNSSIVTSEGKTRKDADGSKARWCYITAETNSGKSTMLFMTFPTNYNYPEPIRVWPEDANNGRGDVFFNFCPTKNKDWKLVPGTNYVLRYRVMVKTGEMTPVEAENAWNSFAHPPVIETKIIK